MLIIIISILEILNFNKSNNNKILAISIFKISPILGSYIYYNKKIDNNLFLLAAYLTANIRLHFTCN